jgi:phospho-N-acetylmuramoyl-pentapeptide-transferase
MYATILKVFIPAVVTFMVGIALTPWLSRVMYQHKLWKRSARDNEQENPGMSAAFSKIHDTKTEMSTPRVGGIVVWLSVIVTATLLWILSKTVQVPFFDQLDLVSRGQTWLLFFGLIVASVIGLVDDLLQIFGNSNKVVVGLTRWQRVGAVIAIGLVGALWLYIKLDISTLYVPFYGLVELGIGFIFLFIVVMLGTFSSSVIDGIDGLAGGVMTTAFSAYGVIAFFQGQMDIAAFCALIVGGLLAFLWFNIPPARFYLGETGMLGLTVTLALVAFFTNQVLVLLIIGFPLVATSLSSTIQMIAKKHFGKKVFIIAPLHYHFRALGWASEKVVMRYWIVSIMCAVVGISVALIG